MFTLRSRWASELTYNPCTQNNGALKDELRSRFKEGHQQASIYYLTFDGFNQESILRQTCVHQKESHK